MKRFKRHKVKEEKPEPSHSRESEEHDLAYYIHDRVELMHQVFSVLKLKELKTMIPESLRNISKDDLQELCTEELLGISSKRLCAILDGAEPPSDTESSSQSPERLETISLDSISSDEEILSQTSKKKKHKHKKHSKSKRKRNVTNDSDKNDKRENKDGDEAQSRAARAGLTVLELLELQARARAIRAQLNQEQVKLVSTSEATRSEQQVSSDEDAVQIKEEPPLVVEISSDEEKPNVAHLEVHMPKSPAAVQKQNAAPTATAKRTTDLTVKVPAAKKTRKIKLNRNKSVTENTQPTNPTVTVISNEKPDPIPTASGEAIDTIIENKNKEAKKVKRTKKKKQKSKDGSDHDEITLQLSDTEKMDLLEDLEGKKHENSSSEYSGSSSSDSDEESVIAETKEQTDNVKENSIVPKKVDETKETSKNSKLETNVKENVLEEVKTELAGIELTGSLEKQTENEEANKSVEEIEAIIETQLNISVIEPNTAKSNVCDEEEPMEVDDIHIEISNVDKLPVVEDDERPAKEKALQDIETETTNIKTHDNEKIDGNDTQNFEANVPPQKNSLQIIVQGDNRSVKTKITELKSIVVLPESGAEKNMSEGEISNAESSEVEVFDQKPEVVCISDEESKKKHKKKSKKKDKKVKKDKKKETKDFCNGGDENFFTEKVIEIVDQKDSKVRNDDVTKALNSPKSLDNAETSTILSDKEQCRNTIDDDIYEILELSDSSCYEVEGVSILSKEPTAEEIEALSAKIDNYEIEEVVTEEQIKEHEEMLAAKQKNEENNDLEQIEHLSWKDRYLDSRKVKQILSTAHVLNAIRKKNIELKKKLAESKKEMIMQQRKEEQELEIKKALEEGSIDQYNTLIGSTTYVDPVPEKQNGGVKDDTDNQSNGRTDKQVTREMKKDAKQLLKMYKKLLKYNDMNKPEDPNKKKKKKMKKKKERHSVTKISTN